MPFTPTPQDAMVLALLGVALVTDLRHRRLPNLLTFGGMALGLVSSAWAGQLSASLWGIGLAFALMFPAWRLGGAVRAGDVKLLMAVGAFYGGSDATRACLLTYLLSLPFGLTMLILRGRLGNLVAAAKHLMGRGPKPELTLEAFAPVILVAVLLTRFTAALASPQLDSWVGR